MLKHKSNTNFKIWWLLTFENKCLLKVRMIWHDFGTWISKRMQKSSNATDTARSQTVSPNLSFLLCLTFLVPIIAAWIFHSKDIALLLQWHDFYCSWETAWIVMAILWPCASFSLSTEFLLLTLTQTFPGNAFPLSLGQIAFYCPGHRPIRDPSAVWTSSEISRKRPLWPV